MPRPKKSLPIAQSKLYRLGRKKDLAALFRLSLPELKKLTSDNNFKEWTKNQKGKKGRIIEEPLPALAAVLSELHVILSAVHTPSWLMSGKKGVKPQDNAEAHCQNGHMVNVDIASFYQSTKREFIYSAFKTLFGHTNDVAALIADLVTYKGHIPTGTATSQLMAFWAYRQTFERINRLCSTHGILMTVWVDDITFSSSKPFPKNWLSDIKKITGEVALSLKTEKTKRYTPSEYKTVTGSAISPDGRILVKNAKRQEIVALLKDKRVERLQLKETRVLVGKLASQRQNESNFFQGVYSRARGHLRKLEKRRALNARRKSHNKSGERASTA